jgi:hypothetical protein
MKLVKSSEEYKALVSDTIATLIEASFAARWAYVEAYHGIGEGLSMYIDTKGLKATEVTAQVAVDVGVSERTLYYALKFYRMYPQLDEAPFGKNITWKGIIKGHLTEGGDKETTPPKSKLPPMTAKGYIEYTKNSLCVIGGCMSKVDPDHFPRTTGAGALSHEVIPLCRVHHTERHDKAFDWWCTTGWNNRVNIFKHFYDFISGDHDD